MSLLLVLALELVPEPVSSAQAGTASMGKSITIAKITPVFCRTFFVWFFICLYSFSHGFLVYFFSHGSSHGLCLLGCRLFFLFNGRFRLCDIPARYIAKQATAVFRFFVFAQHTLTSTRPP